MIGFGKTKQVRHFFEEEALGRQQNLEHEGLWDPEGVGSNFQRIAVAAVIVVDQKEDLDRSQKSVQSRAGSSEPSFSRPAWPSGPQAKHHAFDQSQKQGLGGLNQIESCCSCCLG